MTAEPPPEVAAAAAQVRRWLDGQSPAPSQQSGVKVSDEQFAKMSARERIDYARQWDQAQFQTSVKR
jgi:hypothetical protein